MSTNTRSEDAARWHRMNIAGLSFAAIAAAEGGGLTRNAVIGAVTRHRARHGLAGVVKRAPDARRPADRRGGDRKPAATPAAKRFVPARTAATYEEQVARAGTCRHIAGDPKQGTAVYCAHEALPGRSFCEGHTALCYIPVPRRRGPVVRAYVPARELVPLRGRNA
jgi:hypothetical protein